MSESAAPPPRALDGWRCLYLPGFTTTAVDIDVLAESIGGEWDTLVLPGHAGSRWPGPRITPSDLSEVREAITEWVAIAPGRSLVMGYSSGARPALAAALKGDCRPAAMVLVGATAGIDEPVAASARAEADARLAARIETLGTDAFLREWATHPVIASQQSVPEPQKTRRRMASLKHSAAGLAGNLRAMGQGASAPMWADLPELRTPTLLVTGEMDARYGAIAARMAAASPMIQHAEIPGAGHCAHVEQPYLTAQAVNAFLRAL